jgi:hypothetical protein
MSRIICMAAAANSTSVQTYSAASCLVIAKYHIVNEAANQIGKYKDGGQRR